MVRIMEDFLVSDAHRHARRSRFARSQVADVHWVAAAGNLNANAMAFPETVGGGEQVDPDPADTLPVGRIRVRNQTDDPIADVGRFPVVWRNVTQSYEEIRVLER